MNCIICRALCDIFFLVLLFEAFYLQIPLASADLELRVGLKYGLWGYLFPTVLSLVLLHGCGMVRAYKPSSRP